MSQYRHFSYLEVNDLPVEEVQPKQQSLPLIDLDSADPQPLLSHTMLVSFRRRTSHMANEAYDGHAKCSSHLEELVLDIFLLGESTGGGASLLPDDEKDGCYGCQDGCVEETKGEELALNREDKRDKKGEDGQGCDGDLAALYDTKTGGGVAGEAEAERGHVDGRHTESFGGGGGGGGCKRWDDTDVSRRCGLQRPLSWG